MFWSQYLNTFTISFTSINPYWQNLGKLIRIFFRYKNSFLENSSIFPRNFNFRFYTNFITYSVFISCHELNRFMETHPLLVIGLDEFSRDRFVSSPKILKSVIGQVFQESVWVLPRMVPNRGYEWFIIYAS